jgi:hypothetical protein
MARRLGIAALLMVTAGVARGFAACGDNVDDFDRVAAVRADIASQCA